MKPRPPVTSTRAAAVGVEVARVMVGPRPGLQDGLVAADGRVSDGPDTSSTREVAQGAEDPGEVEELALAVGAVEVVNRHLGDPEVEVGHLLHELDADDPGGAGEVHLVEDCSCRISRKSQSTSRTWRPKASFTK